MMDLIFEYLIVFILLFVTNISLLIRNFDLNIKKFITFDLLYSSFVFVLSFISSSLNYQDLVLPFIPYFLGLIAILVLIFSIINVGSEKIKRFNFELNNRIYSIIGIILSSYISVFILSLSLKVNNNILSSLELSVLSFMVMLLIYKISKIFEKAKREYFVIVGEYMFLEFILLIILAFTFNIVRYLDYSLFNSFLILTPFYQVLSMIIIILFILILGVFYNDYVLKKLKRK